VGTGGTTQMDRRAEVEGSASPGNQDAILPDGGRCFVIMAGVGHAAGPARGAGPTGQGGVPRTAGRLPFMPVKGKMDFGLTINGLSAGIAAPKRALTGPYPSLTALSADRRANEYRA